MKEPFENEVYLPVDERPTMEAWYIAGEPCTQMGVEVRVPVAPDATDERCYEEQTRPSAPVEDKHRRLKQLLLAQLMCTAMAVPALVYAPAGGLADRLPAGDETAIVEPAENGTGIVDVAEPAEDGGVETFPELSNLMPDFAGDYAWIGIGSEEYIRFGAWGSDDYTYLEIGSAWERFEKTDENGVTTPLHLSVVPNARYDAASNTLTLENFSAGVLDVNLMGNGFTIHLIGDNRLDHLCVWGAGYGGSVTLTGTGSLTVNEGGLADVGVYLRCEQSGSCLMVDRGVTLDAYGNEAIRVEDTLLEQGIYYRTGEKLTGGTNSLLETQMSADGVECYDYSVLDEDKMPVHHVQIAPAV